MKITKQQAFERMWKGVAVKNDSILLRILDCNLQYFSPKEEIWKSYDINFNSPTLRDDWSTIDGPEDAFKQHDADVDLTDICSNEDVNRRRDAFEKCYLAQIQNIEMQTEKIRVPIKLLNGEMEMGDDYICHPRLTDHCFAWLSRHAEAMLAAADKFAKGE